jgi:lysozyme family protein
VKENFDRSLHFILQSEGGYINNPNDKGGETNMGITKKFYPNEDIKNLTIQRAGEIYKADYWDKIKGDYLPSGVDYIVFDSAVNHGVKNAGKFLQKAINRTSGPIDVDGIIGTGTLTKAIKLGQILIIEIIRERDIFYRKIVANDPTQECFMNGWMNRLNIISKNVKEFV